MKKNYYRIVAVFVVCLIAIVVTTGLRRSLFFSGKERINVLVYGPKTTYYSMGITQDLNYAVVFSPDTQVQVPGGYQSYRIGAVGKLVDLEKKPVLFQKTFSVATASFVDFYFYTAHGAIYYGEQGAQVASPPSLRELLFLSSNAGFFDRLYSALHLVGKRPQDFTTLADYNSKQSQGLFYQKAYRNEQKNIQIQYHKSYTTAARLGDIIEGNGIRVADVTAGGMSSASCVVRENSTQVSKSARDLADFFHCSLIRADTGVYDILFVLGNLERDWEVQ